jgi:hypothetical protein
MFLRFVRLFISVVTFPANSEPNMSLTVLMSRDNVVYDVVAFPVTVDISHNGCLYRGGFLHNAIVTYLTDSTLFVKDFDYFIRCSDDRVRTREFWRQFVCDNLGPHPDALASEVCNLMFEDLSVRVCLLQLTSFLMSTADPRKESPQSAYELFSPTEKSPISK